MIELARWPRTQALARGTLIRRYKRFLADVELDSGEIVVAHCVNTGAMEGLTRPGIPVWLSAANNPARKLAWTWELAEVDGRTWGVNTALPNKFVMRLLEERRIPWLDHWPDFRPEKKYGEKSRVDFWLTNPSTGCEHFLEVKNCHLLYPDERAYFPDCVSARATEHLHELVKSLAPRARGDVSAEVLFVVQISGALAVRPSDLHDSAFAAAARVAASKGVQFSAIVVDHQPAEIIIRGPVLVDLEPYDCTQHKEWRAGNQNPSQAPGPAFA